MNELSPLLPHRPQQPRDSSRREEAYHRFFRLVGRSNPVVSILVVVSVLTIATTTILLSGSVLGGGAWSRTATSHRCCWSGAVVQAWRPLQLAPSHPSPLRFWSRAITRTTTDQLHPYSDTKRHMESSGGPRFDNVENPKKQDDAVSTPYMSLLEFLRHCHSQPTRHIVIGNEAGDADSLLSAIGWAYVSYLQQQQQLRIQMERSFNNGIDDPDHLTAMMPTPVMSISKRDLQTQRPETTLLLQLVGLTPDDLVYVSDLASSLDTSSSSSQLFNLTLVDHNRFSSILWEEYHLPAHSVVEIVDHHHDEGLYLDSANLRDIAFAHGQALVASTCTLVVERLMTFYSDCAVDEEKQPCYPATLSLLLLGVILLDSVDMSPAAGKVTDRDTAAVQALLQHTRWTDLQQQTVDILQLDDMGRPNTSAFFDALQNAKFALAFWESLSVRDALRLDYKSFQYDLSGKKSSLGVSTVLMPMTSFLSKDDVCATIHQYMDEREIKLLGIMFAYTNNGTGGLHRELMLVAKIGDSFPFDEMVQFLLSNEHAVAALQLSEVSHTETESGLRIKCFTQKNTKSSRKQVAPTLLQFFSNKP